MSVEIIADPQNNNKKCGPQGSPLRVFDLRGKLATEAKCKEECMKDDLCVAFSAKWSKWCIGCKVELSQQTVSPGDQGAIAYKKRKTPVAPGKGIHYVLMSILKSSYSATELPNVNKTFYF